MNMEDNTCILAGVSMSYGHFFLFLPENRIWHFMQIVSKGIETICMKCQILFSGENKQNITNLSSAELAQRVVMVSRVILATPLSGLKSNDSYIEKDGNLFPKSAEM